MVGNDKPAFLSLMQTQFADLFNTNEKNIPLEDMDARSGSTIVTMNVLGYNDEEAGDLEKSYSDLAKMFEDGEVKLVWPNSIYIFVY